MSLSVHTGVISLSITSQKVRSHWLQLLLLLMMLVYKQAPASAAQSQVSNPSGSLSKSVKPKERVWNRVTLTNTLVCVDILGLSDVFFFHRFLFSSGEDSSLTASLRFPQVSHWVTCSQRLRQRTYESRDKVLK